jgi:predicted restriction endonuclease
MGELRLTIEPTQLSSDNNLRERMGAYRWGKLRKQVYADNGYKCAVCGAEGVQLSCHEIWDCDDKKHVQRLLGLTALCNMCHAVKHTHKGVLAQAILATRLGTQGYFDLEEEAAAHFMKVNQCDRATWDKHYDESLAVWEERSKHRWRIDLGEYAHLVTDSPATAKPSRKKSVRKSGGA